MGSSPSHTPTVLSIQRMFCFWAWVVAGLVSLPALLHGHSPGQRSCTVLATSSKADCSKKQSQLSFAQILRSCSPILTLPGSALLSPGLHCIWLAYVAIRAMVISGPEPLSKALSAPLFLMQIGSVVMSITCVSTRFIRTMLC